LKLIGSQIEFKHLVTLNLIFIRKKTLFVFYWSLQLTTRLGGMNKIE